MALFVATALLLAQMSEFVTSTHYCRKHTPVDWEYCGDKPTISNDSAILKWIRWNTGGSGSSVVSAELDLRKIENVWSQMGCFSLGENLSELGLNISATYNYTIPSVDYDSLYIARVWWLDSSGQKYYIKDGDCYFTLQPTPSLPQKVTVVGVTSSSITWTWDQPTNHGNKVTHYHGQLQVFNRDVGNVNITTGTYYQWNGLSANTQYRFRARAVTGSGNNGHWSYWIYHTTLPAVPSSPSVSIDSKTAQSVVLKLSGCTDAGTVKYIVRYSFDNRNELTVETATSNSRLTVGDLRPEKQYTFITACQNTAGMTGLSVTRYARTLSEDTLQPIISSVWINDLSSTTITWSAPSAQVTVTGYDIRILPHARGIPQTPSAIMRNCPGYLTSYTVRMPQGTILRPETVYTFQVRAQTSVGVSQWSTPVVKSTLSTTPPSIDGFTASFPTSTSITLSWYRTNAAIEYYRLTLHNVEANTTEHSDLFHTVNSYTFHNLSPNTAYFVTITAVNKGKSGPTVSVNVTTQRAPVPPHIDGFTVSSSTSTSIALSWDQTTATVEYYRLALHNAEANTTEHSDLFHTVNSHTFHNLSPNTAYFMTITAVNKGKSGPTVSVNVTTQRAPVSPLAITTGALGAMVVMGMVAVPLLIGCTCCMWVSRKKVKDHAASDSNYNCELQENVAYVTAAHTKQWSEACGKMEEKEERCEEKNMSDNSKAIELEPASPQVPCRQYLQEKERGQTMFASIPVFDVMDFKKKSGWYKPTVADVISRKLGMDLAVFADLGPGVYFMRHKTKKQAKWVGLSPDLSRTLCGLFFQLYQKERSELSPLEVELKFFSPIAADWDIQVWSADPKELALERAKKIVEFKTLKPLGLNNALKFTTKEMWEEFTSWFVAQRRNK